MSSFPLFTCKVTQVTNLGREDQTTTTHKREYRINEAKASIAKDVIVGLTERFANFSGSEPVDNSVDNPVDELNQIEPTVATKPVKDEATGKPTDNVMETGSESLNRILNKAKTDLSLVKSAANSEDDKDMNSLKIQNIFSNLSKSVFQELTPDILNSKDENQKKELDNSMGFLNVIFKNVGDMMAEKENIGSDSVKTSMAGAFGALLQDNGMDDEHVKAIQEELVKELSNNIIHHVYMDSCLKDGKLKFRDVQLSEILSNESILELQKPFINTVLESHSSIIRMNTALMESYGRYNIRPSIDASEREKVKIINYYESKVPLQAEQLRELLVNLNEINTNMPEGGKAVSIIKVFDEKETVRIIKELIDKQLLRPFLQEYVFEEMKKMVTLE